MFGRFEPNDCRHIRPVEALRRVRQAERSEVLKRAFEAMESDAPGTAGVDGIYRDACGRMNKPCAAACDV